MNDIIPNKRRGHEIRERISVSPGFFLLAAAAWYLCRGDLLAGAVCTVAAHELGHYLALRLCGIRQIQLRLWAGGLSMTYVGGLSYGKELICVLAGPLAGLLPAAVLLCLPGFAAASDVFLGTAVVFSAFNLLPLSCLDGGRALQLLLLGHTDLNAAFTVSHILDWIILLAVLPFAALAAIRRGIFTLLILTAMLFGICCKSHRNHVK